MSERNNLVYKNRLKTFNETIPKTSEPKPGTMYTVPKNAFIDTIAFKAYGTKSKSSDIVNANNKLLANRNIIAGLPNIYQGDVLWLPPGDSEVKPEPDKIKSNTDTEVTIRLNGKLFHGWTTTSIERSMNSIADSFSFQAPFSPDDRDSFYLDPYTYYPADLFIGGELYISGRAEGWNPQFSTDSTVTIIQCRSRTGVIVDCPSQNKSLNFNKQTLQQITNILLAPFGIKSEFPYGDSGIFSKTKRGITEKIYSYLQKLSKSAGLIVNSTKTGGLKFDRANTSGRPTMSLIQGEPPLLGISASYNGTERFSDYEAISQGNGKAGNRILEKDTSIQTFRPTIFNAKDTNQGNIKNAALWEKSRALAKSAKVTATIATWRDENKNLIMENEIVSLKAPKIHVYNETRFLIEKVSLTDEGKTATLTLVAPESYTLTFPSRFWWTR